MKDLNEALSWVAYCEKLQRECEQEIVMLKQRHAACILSAETARIKLEALKQQHLDWINAHNQGKL